MNIKIEIVEHSKQRYPTVGDWYYDFVDGQQTLIIKVSKLSSWRAEMLIAIHELVEAVLCRHHKIEQETVDKFDMEFEKSREEEIRVQGELFDFSGEPGDNPKAPYQREHCLATAVERMLAAELDINWKQYEDELDSLP